MADAKRQRVDFGVAVPHVPREVWMRVLDFCTEGDVDAALSARGDIGAAALAKYQREFDDAARKGLIDDAIVRRGEARRDPSKLPVIYRDCVFRSAVTAKFVMQDVRWCYDDRVCAERSILARRVSVHAMNILAYFERTNGYALVEHLPREQCAASRLAGVSGAPFIDLGDGVIIACGGAEWEDGVVLLRGPPVTARANPLYDACLLGAWCPKTERMWWTDEAGDVARRKFKMVGEGERWERERSSRTSLI